jgi:hypothetical protein
MSQKTVENGTKPLASKAAAKQSGTAYPGEKQDLADHQDRLKKAAATGTGMVKSSASAATPKLASTPAVMPPKSLTPVAALGPSLVPPRGESKPSQAQALQFQKAPATATVPKASPAPATPPPKPPAQSAPPTSPDKATAVVQTPTPTTPKTVDVRFALSRPDSKRVSLCGEFNGWSPDATPMKQREGGRWEATLALRPGRYQYKFVVDGQWLHDPTARESLPNQHGSLNSVMDVRA